MLAGSIVALLADVRCSSKGETHADVAGVATHIDLVASPATADLAPGRTESVELKARLR